MNIELLIEKFLDEFKRDTIKCVEKAQYNFQDTTEEEIRRFISKMINNLEMERYRLPHIEDFLYDHLFQLKKDAQNKIFDKILDTVLLSDRTLENSIRNFYEEKDEIEKQVQIDRNINNFARDLEFPNELWIENYCEELRSDLSRKYNMREDYELMTLVRRTVTNFSDELMQGYHMATDALKREIEQKLSELNERIHNKTQEEIKQSNKENGLEGNEQKLSDFFDEPNKIVQDNSSQFIDSPVQQRTFTVEELVQEKYNEMSKILNDQALTKEQKDKLSDEISDKYDSQINTVRQTEENQKSLESLFL